MIKQVGVKTVPLTLEIAKHFDRMKRLKGDRDVESARGKARIEYLRVAMVEGRFHSPTWSTVTIGKDKGKKYREDGAHSSRALVQAGVEFPKDLMVTIREFHCDTKEDATYLWEEFNPKVSVRSMLDLAINRSTLVPMYESRQIAPSTILTASRAIATHFNIVDPKLHMKPLEGITEYPQFVLFVNDYLGRSGFKRSGIVAAMFSTWGKSPTHAGVFWKEVRDSTGGDKKDPVRRLNKYLNDLVIAAKYRGTLDLPFVQYVKCHHAWNAWRKGGTTALKYVKGCPVPKPV